MRIGPWTCCWTHCAGKAVAEGTLPPGVAIAVLAAALLHASWNALIRSAGDKGLYTLLLHACSGLLAVPGVILLGLPESASLPYVLASALIHTVYIVWLMRAYDGGQLAVSYTLMRGVPPLLVALLSAPLLGEAPGLPGWLGILCICAGVLAIGIASGLPLTHLCRHPASRAALLNATAIAAYTLVDGIGARLSGNPLAYACCLFAIEPLIVLTLNFRIRGAAMASYFRQHWRLGLLGAIASTSAYAIVLWAMTQAPVAMVAALRESSVVIAVLIGSLCFGEGRLRLGLGAGLLVLAGIGMLRLA